VRRVTLVLLAAFVAVAAGCQESGFDERRETARPLKVQHALGEAKVPGQAERPMTLTADALDDTLALGVRPVRAALPGGRLPAYLRARSRGVEVVPAVTAQDLAAIKAAQPDVILGSAADQKGLYNKFRRIAPTVMTETGGVAWKLNARLHGEALGRTNDAERLLIDYDRRSARLQRALGNRLADTEVSVVLVTPREVRMAGLESFPGSILGDLGLSRPPAQQGSPSSPGPATRCGASRQGPSGAACASYARDASYGWTRGRGGRAAGSSRPAQRCATSSAPSASRREPAGPRAPRASGSWQR
jgi:iron complex transport system substrate-binding protein